MSIQIFHGDNQVLSRQALSQAVSQAKTEGREVIVTDGTKLSLPELDTLLRAESLFTPVCLVIEGLLGRSRGQQKDALIKLLGQVQTDKTILLFDNKLLTKPTTARLSGAKISQFKTPAVIFTFLDSLRPGSYLESHRLFESALLSSDPGFIFVMLTRQVANLLIAKSGDTSKLIPFQRVKLVSQAKFWTEPALLSFHHRLFEVDLAVKTGATKLDYRSHLDLTIATLLK